MTELHTCHEHCPCHAGGEPVPDFVERKPRRTMPATGDYLFCGRCHCAMVEPPAGKVPGRYKPGDVLLCKACLRDEIYGKIVNVADKALLATLCEGEAKYPNLNFWRIVDKPDHLIHAIEHLQNYAAEDTSEDHLAHALTRIALEITRLSTT